MIRFTAAAFVAVVLGLGILGCGQQPGSSSGRPTGGEPSPGAPGQLTAAVATSDLAVGKNQRFLLVVIGPDNRLITDADVNLAFFKVTAPGEAQLRYRAGTTMRESPGLPGRGVYVSRADFDEPGEWGVAAQVARPGREPTEVRIGFQVKDKSATLIIGQKVPPSRTLTGETVAEIERFSSARPVDVSLYRLSIADAIAQKKPFAVLFATPGYCTSRTCGPSLEVLQGLRGRHESEANFVHVEIYKDGQPGEMVAAVSEWGLPSEPWLFLVDGEGRLFEKFEGSITLEEVAPAFERLIGAAAGSRAS